MLTITRQAKGRLLINGQPYQSTQIQVIFNDEEQAVELYDRRNSNMPITVPIATPYNDVVDPDSQEAFNSFIDMKEFITDYFFNTVGSSSMSVVNTESTPLYVNEVDKIDISDLNKEETQIDLRSLLNDIKSYLQPVVKVDVNNMNEFPEMPVTDTTLLGKDSTLQNIATLLNGIIKVDLQDTDYAKDASLTSALTLLTAIRDKIISSPATESTLNSLLSKINSGITVNGAYQATQSISANTLPLPTGAATLTEQQSFKNALLAFYSLDADGGIKVHIQNSSLPATLPTGAATSTKQDDSKAVLDSISNKLSNTLTVTNINREIQILASGTRTTSGVSAAFENLYSSGCMFVVNVTAASGVVPIMSVKVQFLDVGSNTWLDLGVASTNIGVVGLVQINVNPRVNNNLPKNFRIAWTIGGVTPSFTFSVGAHFFN